MSTNSPLIPEQRYQALLRLLRASGVLSIRTLTEQLGVSHMTVRRDIAALEEAGRVESVKGGVRLVGGAGIEPPRERESRAEIEMPRKRVIAAKAATLVRDHNVVFLDAGTTCQLVVPWLDELRDITVVTNDFHTAITLLNHPAIETIHTGGVADHASGSSSGSLAVRTLHALSVDIAFLSTGTWDLAHGLTTTHVSKVDLKQAVLESASSTYLLADSTKWGTFERFKVAPLFDLDGVITDDSMPKGVVKALTQGGLTVHTARPPKG